MKQIYANNCTTLLLGLQGENLVRKVAFDLSDWVSEYGAGTAELIYQRPGDSAPYPVAAVRDGDTLVWTLTATDTDCQTNYGRCELRYYVGDMLAKSKTWQTWVEPALPTPSDTAPPEPEQGWVEQVVAAGVDAKQAAERAENAVVHAPIIGDNGNWFVWDSAAGKYVDTGRYSGGSGSGTSDHSKLTNRGAADQHPMSAITGLADALAGKQPTGNYLTEESDPTVPEWAKQPQKPAYTAQEVGALPDTTHIPSTADDVNAEPSGAVSQHNVSDAAHSDIRLLIQGLSERLSAVADSDDTTLDQLSEIVAYIKSNKSLIDAITTNKVSVTDIVNDLTTNASNKPLSAAQGVALKALIDAISVPDKLPNPNALTFTGAVTGSYDGSAPVSVEIPSGGDNSGEWELVADVTMETDVQQIDIALSKSCKRVWVAVTLYGSTQNSGKADFYISVGDKDYKNMIGNTNRVTIDFSSASMLWSFQSLYAEVSGGVSHMIRGCQTSSPFENGWETPSNYMASDLRELFRSTKLEKIETVRLSMWGVYFGAGTRVVVKGA